MITSHYNRDWFHVDSKLNTEDCAARGLKAGNDNVDIWFSGPAFLRDVCLPLSEKYFPLQENNVGLKAKHIASDMIAKNVENTNENFPSL